MLLLKTVLLTALALIKRVGDLQAFSVKDSCLKFGPGNSHVVLRPRLRYVPKVPTTPFRDQVVNLRALHREKADPAIALLCPVHALYVYVDCKQSCRISDQLFVCFGGQQKGKAVSKQRLAHWIVEAFPYKAPPAVREWIYRDFHLHSACEQFLSGQKRTEFACPAVDFDRLMKTYVDSTH